jgi:hypothetical protein
MKKMLVVLATLALLAMSNLAMAGVNPYEGVQTTINVELTVNQVAEVFWGDASTVKLTVEDYGENLTGVKATRNLKVLNNDAVSVHMGIKPGTDLAAYTQLTISVDSTNTNQKVHNPASLFFYKDDLATVVPASDVLFTKDASSVGAVNTDAECIIPVAFKASAWNGVAAVGKTEFSVVATISIP